MIQQLQESIDFDCSYSISTLNDITVEEYKELKLKELNWNIKYHQEEWDKEVEYNKKQNLWIKQLLKSLPNEQEF